MRKRYSPSFTLFTAMFTAFLLVAGALVTGTGSGLAVPDWPLSFGQFFPKMEGGVFYEHGHRLVAGTVAILAVGQALVLSREEERDWVKKLGWAAVVLVLLQALLGGMTVLFRLPTAVSVAHACLAQAFFCSTVVLAFATSSGWSKSLFHTGAPATDIHLKNFATVLTGFFILQLLMGAIMRHLGAGLSIPDFPTVFGGILPPYFTPRILIHFLHRLGAFILIGLTAAFVIRIYRSYSHYLYLVGMAGLLVSLLSFQFMLGAMVVWLRRPVSFTTIHLLVGAFCLATSVVLLITCHRLEQTDETAESASVPLTPTWEPT